MPRRPYTSELHDLADAGELIPVRVDGWKADAFVHRDLADRLDDVAAGHVASTVTTVLSPFDPVVWDRKRASVLFGFDYAIECYTPAAKRKYGYFALPILHRGRLIGRVDAKAHRTQGVFELKSLHMEPGVRIGTGLTADLRRALQRCADWGGVSRRCRCSCSARGSVDQRRLDRVQRTIRVRIDTTHQHLRILLASGQIHVS